MKQTINKPVTLLQICSAFALYCVIAFNSVSASNGYDKNWQFKVFLDDDEIGTHSFSTLERSGLTEVYSDARFDVNFLFINIYNYQHTDIEHWRGQCLDRIEASTNDNGEKHKVSGKVDNDSFVVNTLDKVHRYKPCVKTFAYWDPSFLMESELLNSQTGEMIQVESQLIGYEAISHRGQTIDARRYRLTGKDLQIDLWYSEDNIWLALESLTEGGRIVRYATP